MKPFDIRADVTLECPRCRAYKTVPRTPELPPAVRLIEIICPDCDDGDFHAETWFSAPGVEVSQDDRRSSCDVCGATDRPTATVVAYGIETNACDKCRDGGPR